uniref:Uncharacterized protein n=1 Tax=Lygus hesperus TaxID=30085 RepID=A0A0A9XVE9_LYGHE
MTTVMTHFHDSAPHREYSSSLLLSLLRLSLLTNASLLAIAVQSQSMLHCMVFVVTHQETAQAFYQSQTSQGESSSGQKPVMSRSYHHHYPYQICDDENDSQVGVV